MKIGDRIKQFRKANNLTQEEFANLVHLNRNSIYKYEKGENPTITNAKIIAEVMGITLAELLSPDSSSSKGNINILAVSNIVKELFESTKRGLIHWQTTESYQNSDDPMEQQLYFNIISHICNMNYNGGFLINGTEFDDYEKFFNAFGDEVSKTGYITNRKNDYYIIYKLSTDNYEYDDFIIYLKGLKINNYFVENQQDLGDSTDKTTVDLYEYINSNVVLSDMLDNLKDLKKEKEDD